MGGRIKTARPRVRAADDEIRNVAAIPTRFASQKLLRVTYDVSELTPDEISELQLELAVQADDSEGHRAVPAPAFTLVTMRIVHGEPPTILSEDEQ